LSCTLWGTLPGTSSKPTFCVNRMENGTTAKEQRIEEIAYKKL
jgi:hypothetical protein